MSKAVVAIDAMGGDFGPSVTVPGALLVASKSPNLHLILVGDEQVISNQLARFPRADRARIEIQHASEVVTMEDKIAVALRVKKDSSMRVSANMVKAGRAQAFVSAGNTGALMAVSRFVLKTHKGIDRPAILTALPTMTGHIQVLDLGANVDCSAVNLLEFAQMGSILAKAVDGKPSPKVALLNIGEEEIKGNEQIKGAAELIKQHPEINYTGFIEGDGIFRGEADVVVCDGFVGNIMLKTTEGVAKMIGQIIKDQIASNWYTKFAAALAFPIWKGVKRETDPGRFNGASLVGLKGIVIKSHGSADVNSFASAVALAAEEVEKDIPALIEQQFNPLSDM